MHEKEFRINFFSSLASGIANTSIFNPIDRMMYLAIKHQNSFTDQFRISIEELRNVRIHNLGSSNFFRSSSLYSGLFSIWAKTFSNSTFFLCQGISSDYLDPYLLRKEYHNSTVEIFSGLTAGAINAAIFATPLNTARYSLWNATNNQILLSLMAINNVGGITRFYTGLQATIFRDAIFGGVYKLLRKEIQASLDKINPEFKKINDATAICAASSAAVILSSPFNYIKNRQVAHILEKDPRSTTYYLQELKTQVSASNSTWQKIKTLQQLLLLNAGIIRMSLGFIIGQMIFDYTKEYLEQKEEPSFAKFMPASKKNENNLQSFLTSFEKLARPL